MGSEAVSETGFEEESFCPSPDRGPGACDCLSHAASDISLTVDEIPSSSGRVDVDAILNVGDEGLLLRRGCDGHRLWSSTTGRLGLPADFRAL
jgi:hypothetical protein